MTGNISRNYTELTVEGCTLIDSLEGCSIQAQTITNT